MNEKEFENLLYRWSSVFNKSDSGFKPIFPQEYVQGYTAALLDVLNVIEDIQDDLKVHHVIQSAKTYMSIVNAMIAGRTILRENPDAFVRCKQGGGFEIFIQEKGVYEGV